MEGHINNAGDMELQEKCSDIDAGMSCASVSKFQHQIFAFCPDVIAARLGVRTRIYPVHAVDMVSEKGTDTPGYFTFPLE